MKFGRKTVKNVSDRFENIIFEKYEPKLTWEQLSIAVVKPEPTFFMGGNNFYFFTPKYLGFISNFRKLNPPMPDSKSAQSWYFFVILESNNFLGFQNIYPELHDPSWFWQLFLFCLNSLLFVCLITRDRICKKVMQNEMIMILHNYMSLRDFKSFLC